MYYFSIRKIKFCLDVNFTKEFYIIFVAKKNCNYTVFASTTGIYWTLNFTVISLWVRAFLSFIMIEKYIFASFWIKSYDTRFKIILCSKIGTLFSIISLIKGNLNVVYLENFKSAAIVQKRNRNYNHNMF